MKTLDFPTLRLELEARILARTGRRVRNLDIQMSSNSITLHGTTLSFYDKQLAQQGVLEVLPQVRLHNAIIVS
jgi:hypothetical protein